jgi:maltooligosyltrehalose trehalohydrolase
MMAYRQPGVSFTVDEARILVWAPDAQQVSIQLEATSATIGLEREVHGYWSVVSRAISPGDRYRIVLDGKDPLPDPASLKQPDGVHGPSDAVDIRSLSPQDAGWSGIPLSEYIIYELHTGTFSEAGTFSGIADRLDLLQELGITAIEIMPIAAFPGNSNWGYDGVFPFAAHAGYGGPEGLASLVTAAHSRGIAVVLDVVYNHLGPEGNYFGSYGPYFTEKYQTPWGSAINFDDAGCDAVREYFLTNALMWLRDFHIDALRLDAVHAIKDFGAAHFLRELRKAVDALEHETGRRYHLIIENDLNDPRYIGDYASGGFANDAQWVDEFHHALRVAAGQPKTGYYSDFDGLEHLAKSYRDAYVYDGQYSPHRNKRFGAPAEHARGERFVVFSQNHDQVGNRMLGERSSTLYSFEMQKLLVAAVFISPYIPLIFMGEEWSEPAPFQYFISHSDPELIEAVRNGRREEFKSFHAEGEAPDPQDEQTFLRCKLNWQLLHAEPHATMLRYYKALIRLRKTHPALRPDREKLEATADAERGILILKRADADRSLLCVLNFSPDLRSIEKPVGATLILDSAAAEWGGHNTLADHDSASIQVAAASCVIYEFHV